MLDRRGIIGFMVTLALGVAVGAATLVVGNEVVKELKEKKAAPAVAAKGTPQPASSRVPGALQTLANKYEQAKKEYYAAVAKKSADVRQKLEAFTKTRQDYQLAMDQYKAAVRSSRAGTSNAGAQKNPFADDETGSRVQVQPAVQTSAGGSGAVAVSADKTSQGITGMEYYKVKAGDSLSKICQRYYGDSGMWAHILKYQIPSIAALPNLIFPGQLIALPRYLTTGGASADHGADNSGSQASPLPTAPKGDESWSSTFQKDFLISDYTFTNANTMTVAQIQSFLEKKGSVLAKPYNGSTPAKMIYDAARKHGINPQVLLTRLQCEQGLISAKSASQKQLDWALGVGAYDSGNWNSKFKGFDKQIDGAAATYKRHYLDAKKKLDAGQAVTMTIDGQQVRVKSAATYSFYKYCPHFHGNKLFYDVWRGYSKSF